MNKPNNYEATEAYTGDIQTLTTGGKICTIVNAYETTTRSTGKPMLVIEFDVAEGNEKGYYDNLMKQFGGDWRGVYRQGVVDASGECSPWFKGMITAIEESNDRYKFNFDERTLIGKRFGGVFGEEEYEAKDFTIKTIVKLMQIRSVDAIRNGKFKVPEKKALQTSRHGATPGTDAQGFTDVKAEDCPF